MSGQRRLVVLGIMGQLPFAGVGWQVLHYLEGLRRLGHEVHYLEDTGNWAFDPEQNAVTADCRYAVAYIGRLMSWCGLDDRWAYRNAAEDRRVYGLASSRLSRVLAEADAIINLTGGTVLREEHLRVPVRIYVETDPVLPQIEVAVGRRFTTELLAAHTHHFTFGERIGQPDCHLPVTPFAYQPTRQPVVLEWWAPTGDRRQWSTGSVPSLRFTTVATWEQRLKQVEWNGETYRWSKHQEFLKLVDLPGRTRHQLELALARGDTDPVRFEETTAWLSRHGWTIADAIGLSKEIMPYRNYIGGSDGEFTVAKEQYVRFRTGWFSDRSACYLAAGRPVVTQDTGFGEVLPTGRGLFAFRNAEDIPAALDAIAADYEAHRRRAAEIAAEYFGAERVLVRLLDRCGL